ncbi:MAG: OmpA family protein [Bacteroidetes bacterium]|nr:OmpA family protein [Bacteroidota bacterium]
MKRILYPVLLMIFAFGVTFPLTAQEEAAAEEPSRKEKKAAEAEAAEGEPRINWDAVLKDWSGGIHIGSTMPYTDVRSYDWFRKTKPVNEYQWGVGAHITKMMGGIFGIQGRYTYGRVRGFSNFDSEFTEDAQYWELAGFEDPFYFETDFHSPSVSLYMNFSNMFMGLNRKIRANAKDKEMKERRVSAYGRAGIGAVWFDSELKDIETDKRVGNQFGRGFSGSVVEVAFPFALGLKFKVNHLIDISLEGEFTFIHDDKFDALIAEAEFKDRFILDINQIPDNRVRSSLGGRYDKFLFINAGIDFKFGTLKSQDEHIEWVNPLEAYMDDNDAKVQYLLDNMYEVKDADNDGVIDELDQEPGTAEGAHVNTHGVTLDSDGDGFPDHEDPEPYSTPGLEVDADGKNVYPATWTPDEIKNYVTNAFEEHKTAGWTLSMIFFDLDKSDIKPEMVPELYHVATVMKKFPDLTVNVKGHTDVRHKDDYNLNLSEERTAAAIAYLVENYGIAAERFTAGFFGEGNNLFPDAKKENEHSLNRRVEFSPANY